MNPDTDIANYLAGKVPQFDLAAARHAGTSDTDIANYLAGKVPQFDLAGARASYAGGSAMSRHAAAVAPALARADSSVANDLSPAEAATNAVAPFAGHLLNSLTLGQGHRIAAAAGALTGAGSYSDLDAKYKQSLALDSKYNKVAALSGDLVGTVANPLNPLLFGGAGASVMRQAAGAGVAGAVQGSGSAGNSLEDQVKGTALGGVAGVGAGALLGKIMPTASHAISSAVGRIFPTSAATLIERAVMADGGPAAVQARIAAAGPDATLLDGGPTLQALSDHAATLNPAAKAELTQALAQRQAGQGSRLISSLQKLSGSDEAPQTIQANARTAQVSYGDKAFNDLRDKYGSLPATKDLQDVLTKPGMSAALDKLGFADDVNGTRAAEKTKAFMSMLGGEKIDPAKSLGLTQLVSPEDQISGKLSYSSVSQFRRFLQQQADKNFSGVNKNGDVARAYLTLRNGVDDYLGNVVPEHGAAVAQYRKLGDVVRAAKQGAIDFNSNEGTSLIPSKVASLQAANPDAAKAYQNTIVSKAADKIESSGFNRDVAAQFLGARGTGSRGSTAMSRKLLAALGQKNYDAFQSDVQREVTLAATRSPGAGSQTAARIAAGAAGGAGLGGTAYLYKHPDYIAPAAAVGAGGYALMHGRAAAAGDMAPALLSSGDAITSLLSSYKSPSPSALLPLASRGIAGLLAPQDSTP